MISLFKQKQPLLPPNASQLVTFYLPPATKYQEPHFPPGILPLVALDQGPVTWYFGGKEGSI